MNRVAATVRAVALDLVRDTLVVKFLAAALGVSGVLKGARARSACLVVRALERFVEHAVKVHDCAAVLHDARRGIARVEVSLWSGGREGYESACNDNLHGLREGRQGVVLGEKKVRDPTKRQDTAG